MRDTSFTVGASTAVMLKVSEIVNSLFDTAKNEQARADSVWSIVADPKAEAASPKMPFGSSESI
jgi:hypothetical protein